jgi:hypothetical protein
LLEVFLAPHAEGRRSAGGASEVRHLHATDTEGEWQVRLLPAGMEVGRGHGKVPPPRTVHAPNPSGPR